MKDEKRRTVSVPPQTPALLDESHLYDSKLSLPVLADMIASEVGNSAAVNVLLESDNNRILESFAPMVFSGFRLMRSPKAARSNEAVSISSSDVCPMRNKPSGGEG